MPELSAIKVEALADTDALMLCIPKCIALQLKLATDSMRAVSVAGGRSTSIPYVSLIQLSFRDQLFYVGVLVLDDEVL